MDGTVLVADDDRTIRTVLTQALTRAGCKVHATSSLTTLMRWVAEGRGDVVISDVVMPDGNGLEMLPKIAEDRPGLPVIVISAQNTIMTAIKANEADAYDYLPKPFDLPDLMKRTARALDNAARAPKPRESSERPDELPLVGRTPAMQALYRVVARVMNTDLPVLICGGSGTGKSLIARAIHDFSDRRGMPFVTVTPGDLVDLEGPTKLMARARGGTIVLEEIADLNPEAQGRVVRMMDAPGEDVPRFMATTQIAGSAAMQAAGLREDLYYRMGGAVIDVPALCDRVDDIPLLVAHFLGRGGTRRDERTHHVRRGAGTDAQLYLARQCAAAGKRGPADRADRPGRGDFARRSRGDAEHPARSAAPAGPERQREPVGISRPAFAAVFRSARRYAAAIGALCPDSA